MKKITLAKIAIIFIGIVALTNSCTKPSAKTATVTPMDSVFNGSTFNIHYYDGGGNYVSYTSKDVSYNKQPLVKMTATTLNVDSVNNITAIRLFSENSLYGVPVVNFYLLYSGHDTGTYAFSSPTNYGKLLSTFGQTNPDITFTDSSGVVDITHSGFDYIEGTFTTNIYTQGVNYSASGSFTVYYDN